MKNINIAIGCAIGLGAGTVISLLYVPELGEEARKILKGETEIIEDTISKSMFKLKWMIMSPRERYLYLWTHGGSLRELYEEQRTAEPS